MSTFKPAVGVRVYDALNDEWFALTPEYLADMEREIAAYGWKRGTENWDGMILDGWLPPTTNDEAS
jgi:hypothetical protein